MAMYNEEALEKCAALLCGCFANGGKLLVCGNGGSSADSAHIVGELVKGFLKKRPLPAELCEAIGTNKLQQGLPAIDLTAHAALISAVANDLGGEYCYAQQVVAYGKPGDVLIGISTSGNAKNVALAMKTAGALGLSRIALTGAKGGAIRELCEVWAPAESNETYLIQEEHLRFYHQLCARVEAEFFAE